MYTRHNLFIQKSNKSNSFLWLHNKSRDYVPQNSNVVVASGYHDLGKECSKSLLENYAIKYSQKNIQDITDNIDVETKAILLVDKTPNVDTAVLLKKINKSDFKKPVFVLCKESVSDNTARECFSNGADDVVRASYVKASLPYIIHEHNLLKEKNSSAIETKRFSTSLSKAIIARIKVLTTMGSRIYIYTKKGTAFILAKSINLKMKKNIEKIALQTPGVSDVVLTHPV